MIKQLEIETHPEIVYPDSDGQPIADNTVQFGWIIFLYHNLAWLFAENPEIFVAGDLLWYPVQGNNKLRQAPDVMVTFGVSKGDRGSYQQWKENDIAPQVVFEILSPGNTLKEMSKKRLFYDNYGVEEYYLYDPQKNDLTGWLRSGALLDVIEEMNGWVSPRLGIKFEVLPEILQLYRPDGQLFADYFEVQQRLDNTQKQLDNTQKQLNEERQAKEVAEERAKRLEQLLREAGIDPDIK